VLVPAFRQDSRCEVVALAGTDAERTARLARAANIGHGFGSWQALVDDPAVLLVAVAVPPDLQPAIAQRALELGKPVFLGKPLAADPAGARTTLESARKSGRRRPERKKGDGIVSCKSRACRRQRRQRSGGVLSGLRARAAD